MAELPTRYYVQRSQTDSTYGPPRGWETVIVSFARETANAYAEGFERAVLFEDAENVSEVVSTVARVVTADELRAEGEDALASAEMQTRIQFWQELEKWASGLVAKDHAG